MRSRPTLVLLALLLCACLPAVAAAQPYTPPRGKVWNGLTAGFDARDFQSRTGKHPAVWQHFIAWGQNYQYTLSNSRDADARLMYHLSTSKGQNLPERFSPGQIARGAGDGYLIQLTRSMADMGAPTYMRLMGEMNNCNNPYAAYSCSGGRRDADHSPRTFIKAWKRAYLIMHGGDVPAIDARLAALGLPEVQAGAETIPQPQIAFVWAPMTGGAPNISALRPQVYWPGRRWVDWVGTSFYSRFPNFSGLERFYRDFAVGQAQAVRDRRVGDLGRGRARLRRPALRLDRQPPAGEDGPLQPGQPAGRDLPAEQLPGLGARHQAAPQERALPRLRARAALFGRNRYEWPRPGSCCTWTSHLRAPARPGTARPATARNAIGTGWPPARRGYDSCTRSSMTLAARYVERHDDEKARRHRLRRRAWPSSPPTHPARRLMTTTPSPTQNRSLRELLAARASATSPRAYRPRTTQSSVPPDMARWATARYLTTSGTADTTTREHSGESGKES